MNNRENPNRFHRAKTWQKKKKKIPDAYSALEDALSIIVFNKRITRVNKTHPFCMLLIVQ